MAGGGGVSPRELGQASLTGAPEQRNEESAGRSAAHFLFQDREQHAETWDGSVAQRKKLRPQRLERRLFSQGQGASLTGAY